MAVRIISFSHTKELFCLLLFYFRCVPYRYKLYNKIKMHFYHQVAPTKKQKPISKLRGTHRLCGITFPNIIKSCSILKFIRACSSI